MLLQFTYKYFSAALVQICHMERNANAEMHNFQIQYKIANAGFHFLLRIINQ